MASPNMSRKSTIEMSIVQLTLAKSKHIYQPVRAAKTTCENTQSRKKLATALHEVGQVADCEKTTLVYSKADTALPPR